MNINKLIEGQIEEILDVCFPENIDYNRGKFRDIMQTTLIKFLDSEIERLEKDKARVNGLTLRGELEHGYILFVEDQITHLQDIKKQLK